MTWNGSFEARPELAALPVAERERMVRVCWWKL